MTHQGSDSSWTQSQSQASSSYSSVGSLEASWSNYNSKDDWIEVDDDDDEDEGTGTPTARGCIWTCYVCLQDFPGHQPPIDTQIRRGSLTCRSCYTFQTCWKCHLQCECQHARHLATTLEICRLCCAGSEHHSPRGIDLAVSIDIPNSFQSQCSRSQSTSAEELSYIFPSLPTQRRASAPPLLYSTPSPKRGRTRIRTPPAPRSGKSSYRYSSPRVAAPLPRASSAPCFYRPPPQCTRQYFDDGSCDTPAMLSPSHPLLSSLFSTRQTPLPKLGGTQPCGGCGVGVTYFESVMGPQGKRLHMRCLRCGECGKAMESGSAYELTHEGLMRFCCRHCMMEKSELVLVSRS